MLQQPAPLMNVLPDKQREVLLQNALDEGTRKRLSNGPAMLVENDATRLIQHLPAAFPGHHPDIGVFEIKRPEKVIESANLEKLAAVKRAGATTCVETRIGIRDRLVNAVPHTQGTA